MKTLIGILKNTEEFRETNGRLSARADIKQNIWNPEKKEWEQRMLEVWFYEKEAEKLLNRKFLLNRWCALNVHSADGGEIFGDSLPVGHGFVSVPAETRDFTNAERADFLAAFQELKSSGSFAEDEIVSPSKAWEVEKAITKVTGSSEAEKRFRSAAFRMIWPSKYTYIGPAGSVKATNGNVSVSVGISAKDAGTRWCDITYWGRDGEMTDEGRYASEKITAGDTIVLQELTYSGEYNGRAKYNSRKKPRILVKHTSMKTR